MTRGLMEPAVRPLTEREVRRLRGRLRAAEKRERSGRTGPIVAGAAASAALWALTLLASDAPAGVITVFWLAVGGGITVWVLREHGRELAGTVEPLSIVYAMAEGGHAATMDIESRADRGTPSRKLPARFRFVDDFPEHLEVRTGTIENLERILDPEVLGT
jgi:hypothetical protein